MKNFGASAASLALLFSMLAATARAQTFEVDFSRPSGPPLSKTKFGVYQTPLVTLPRLLNSIPLLREAGVQDFRYEMGWGKPDVLAHDQISGSATHLALDFSTIDALLNRLRAVGARPLLAMGYCPNPLKSRLEWAAWKDIPSDLSAWEQINRDYARHLRQAHPGVASGIAYEVWNEPDMPEPNGKMFFSGGPEDYAQLFRRAQSGIRSGDSGALVGGSALAYDLRYLAPIADGPLDFASIHAYDNFQGQIANLTPFYEFRTVAMCSDTACSDLSPSNATRTVNCRMCRFMSSEVDPDAVASAQPVARDSSSPPYGSTCTRVQH